MTAHRVGVLGALIAVVVLSLELIGAVAWKHHTETRQARWETRGTELTLGTVNKLVPLLDSTLEDVCMKR